MILKCDGVFEGGGVKGIGLAGAFSSIEKAGYEFVNVAGASAGAIISSLIAVGYTSIEVKEELQKLDYNKFKQEDLMDKFGVVGKSLSIGLNWGIYNADYFEKWLSELLEKKKKTVFGDIRTEFEEEKYRYRFNAIASDLTGKRMLVLPNDLKDFGINPDDFKIATAVRMSMSIPLFFEPYKLTDINGREHIIVDGGLLSNYPIWLLDDGTKNPPWPTFGFKFSKPAGKPEIEHGAKSINNIIDYASSLLKTMLEAHDKFHISNSNGDSERTIFISTEINSSSKRSSINTTDFDITLEECNALFSNGYDSAEKFISSWNFDEWIEKYRKK